MEGTNKRIKILCIGNSFSEDTARLVPEAAKALGFEEILVANLYIGGCPIHLHYRNLTQDLPAYRYDRNDGSGWESTPDYKIRDAIRETDWDWISIQHGSSYGGSYTVEACYQDLPALVAEVRALANEQTKIAFNMTWVGEPDHDHHEMLAFGRDQFKLFAAVCEMTQQVVAPTAGIDVISPAGTAVQNVRTTALKHRTSRDGYHLSKDIGRYAASLVFLKTLTGVSVDSIPWAPELVTADEKQIVLAAVNAASRTPFRVTELG